MAMRFSKPRRSDDGSGLAASWKVAVGCPSCGEVLRSARQLSTERLLDAHHHYGCRQAS